MPFRSGFTLALAVGWLPCLSHPGTAQDEDAASLFETFLSEHGEDLDGCFNESVEFQSAPPGPDLASDRPPVPKKLIIAVDASGSMAGAVGSVTKMDAAISAVQNFIATLPETLDVGLVGFGHQGNNQDSGKTLSCDGVEVLAPAGTDHATIKSELEGLSATGWTPLASAIDAAGSQFEPSDTPGEQLVYVVSDGEETCGGDPIAAARRLHESNVRAVVNIIGLDLPQADRNALQAVASAGGGIFSSAANGNELLAALQVRARNIGEMTRIRAMSGHATRKNNSAVGGVMLRVNTCTAGIITRENREFGRWQRSLRDARTPQDILDRLNVLRRERHDAARTRASILYDDLSARNKAANAAIRENADAAEEANDVLEQAQ